MSRARIVLETSDPRKAALFEAADLQGESLTDWIEEQILATNPNSAEATISHKVHLKKPFS